jgi:hypothetical protein
MTQYRDIKLNKNFSQEHACKIEIPAIDPQQMLGIVDDLKHALAETSGDINDTALASPDSEGDYANLLYWIHAYEESLSDLLEMLTDRMILCDNLMSHIVPERLPVLFQAQKCYTTHSLESMDIRFCQRYNEGMYCEVYVTSQTKTESAELFTMINYEGLELALNAENSQLIRISDGTFKTIQCSHNKFDDTDAAEFQFCSQETFEPTCLEALFNQSIDKMLKNCNFTFATPEAITITTDGILLQGNTISSVKEIDVNSGKTVGIIKNEFPVLLTTNSHLEINTDHKEITIRPTRVYSNHTANYTWVKKEDLNRLLSTTKMNHLIHTTQTGTWIDLAYGILIFIFIPGILYTYRLCISGAILNVDCCSRKPKKANPKKLNYRANKRILLKEMSPLI